MSITFFLGTSLGFCVCLLHKRKRSSGHLMLGNLYFWYWPIGQAKCIEYHISSWNLFCFVCLFVVWGKSTGLVLCWDIRIPDTGQLQPLSVTFFLGFYLFAAWSKTLMSGPLLGYSYSATGPERSRKWIIIHHVKVFPIYPCSSSSRPEQPKLISKQTFLEISDWSGQGVRASRTMKHWEHLVELPTPQMKPLLDNTICQSIKNFHERTKKRGKICNNLNLNQPTRPQLQIDFVNCPLQIQSLCCQDENTSTTEHNMFSIS